MLMANCGSICLSYHTFLKRVCEHGFSLLLLKAVLVRGVKERLQETFLSEFFFTVLSCTFATPYPPFAFSAAALTAVMPYSCPQLVSQRQISSDCSEY